MTSATSAVLSDQQVTQYQEEGYTLARQLIDPELLKPVRQMLMQMLDGDHDWPLEHFQVLPPDRYRAPNGKYIPWGVQLPARHSPDFRQVADHPNLQTAMAQLLGGPVVRHTDQALIKSTIIREEQAGATFYHQDSYYWKLQPRLGCNAWIALDEVDRDAIALAILPGTHKNWKLTPHESYYDEPAGHNAISLQPFLRHRIPFDKVDFSKEVLLPMKPGDAAFFTNFTWHRADPNRSGEHKCAYAIAYKLQQQA